MTYQKHAIRFPSHDGECAGDLYLPEGTLAPIVIMAHGIGADRDFRLDAFAEYFASRGLAALVFDYRNIGESPGEPRYLVDPKRHIEDYLSAIDHVLQDKRVDGKRLALWGTSFSGGHVLAAAASRPKQVKAVVSQFPFVNGLASSLLFPLRYLLPAIRLAVTDTLSARLGKPAVTVPVIAEGELALLTAPDCTEAFNTMVPAGSQWPNRVPARILLSLPFYNPAASAPRVKAATLMIGARDDSLIPIWAVRKTARRLPNGKFLELPIGHFTPYLGEWFEKVAEVEYEFLAGKL